jgi:hypothetical protein
MSPDLTNRMIKAVTRQHWGPRIKGARHEYLSAKMANAYAEIAPIAYGGIVISWASLEV